MDDSKLLLIIRECLLCIHWPIHMLRWISSTWKASTVSNCHKYTYFCTYSRVQLQIFNCSYLVRSLDIVFCIVILNLSLTCSFSVNLFYHILCLLLSSVSWSQSFASSVEKQDGCGVFLDVCYSNHILTSGTLPLKLLVSVAHPLPFCSLCYIVICPTQQISQWLSWSHSCDLLQNNYSWRLQIVGADKV